MALPCTTHDCWRTAIPGSALCRQCREIQATAARLERAARAAAAREAMERDQLTLFSEG